MPKRFIAAAGVLMLAFVSWAGLGHGEGTEADKTSVAMAKQQVQLARKVLAELRKSREAGSLVHSESNTDLWWKRLIESLRDSHADKAEIVEALQGFAEYSKAAADSISKLEKIGGGAVPKIRVYDFQYESLEAQSWLAQELGD